MYFLMHKAQYRMKVQKVRLMNILWRLSPAPINVTTTAAVKAETVSQRRIVQII